MTFFHQREIFAFLPTRNTFWILFTINCLISFFEILQIEAILTIDSHGILRKTFAIFIHKYFFFHFLKFH